jgi:predicted DNA-binding mobile mystery protein A
MVRQGEKARQALDRRLASLRPVDRFDRPPRGWVRAIRDALGMSTTQLGRRLGIDRSNVVRLEQSEMNDTIGLGTLRRAAEALDCTLVYALVPNSSLEAAVAAQARRVAAAELASVEHTMLLEAQELDDESRDTRVEDYAAGLVDDPRLWA